MNFPTLYFWLASFASTYFHPSLVEHVPHEMSATTCHPVTSCRFSFRPTLIFSKLCCPFGGATRKARPCRPVKPFDTICDANARSVEQLPHRKVSGSVRESRFTP